MSQLTLRKMLPCIKFPNAMLIPLDAVMDRKRKRENAEAERQGRHSAGEGSNGS